LEAARRRTTPIATKLLPLDLLAVRPGDRLGWRERPGILGQHAATPQSVHALLGYFLRDRRSPTPFPGRDALAREGLFDWGLAPPLEKVIETGAHLEALLGRPELYRNSISVIEPWPNVGTNPRGEAVRASKNLAYLLQQIADADTILHPVWRSGIRDAERLASMLSAGIATIVQGGSPSVHEPSSFDGGSASLEDILGLVDRLLLHRSPGSGPVVFICLGHQLAAASHVRLLQAATAALLELPRLPMDADGRALTLLKRACARIVEVGRSLRVVKRGEIVATGWDDRRFAVARNEAFEIGTRRLQPHVPQDDQAHVPEELLQAHGLVADELEGVLDLVVTLEREVHVEMFHGDEVNEEAILFANWAYKTLHEAIVPVRHALAVSRAAWLLSLPYGVEILGQTQVDESTWTEVCATAIYYKDWETQRVRRSFTCQFHPELMADIRDIGGRPAPRYHDLKEHDGVRLLIRLLYHGMQE
jgi:GMP synthase-like glutamine amidotransferase